MSAVQEMTFDEIDLVQGGDAVADGIGGLIAIGGGAASIGSGLTATGIAAGLLIGGGALAVVGGGALICYGIYEYVHNQ